METKLVPEHALVDQHKKKRTGWAILSAVILTFVFYFLYSVLFRLVVSAFGAYDKSFTIGFCALILIVFAPNVLGFFSGALVALKIFPRANPKVMFYALATFAVLVGGVSVFIELSRDGSWIVAGINILIVTIAVMAFKSLFLFERH